MYASTTSFPKKHVSQNERRNYQPKKKKKKIKSQKKKKIQSQKKKQRDGEGQETFASFILLILNMFLWAD